MVRTQLAERGIRDRRVLDAMLEVPGTNLFRHRFVTMPTKTIR
jgi:protein-L-isoaspartate O-methyltransferase